MSHSNTLQYKENTRKIKILTDEGYVDFDGIRTVHYDRYLVLELKNGQKLGCSEDHLFLKADGFFTLASDLEVGDTLQGKGGKAAVTSKTLVNEPVVLYDIINSTNHRYISAGVVSHNCEFLSDKGTLIASDVLESITGTAPFDEYRGMNLWGSFRGRRLGVSVDVAEGIGQDYSVIQVFDIDTFFQVAEYRDNSSGQTELARLIVRFMEKMDQDGATEIFYTVESNPIGKGVLTLLENYTTPILDKAELVSEYKKKHRGILTTNKNKLFGCSKFKDLVEAGKIQINSTKLISELKFFVKSGASFKAESGMHDDLVMSCIVMMNMMEEISHMDDGVHENFNTLEIVDLEEDEGEGFDDPLPVVF